MWAGGWWCRRDRWKWRGKNGMEYTVQVLQRIGHTPGPPSKPSSCLHSCLDHSFLINRESTVTCAQMCNLNMQLTEIVLLEHSALHTGQSGLVTTDEASVTLTNISNIVQCVLCCSNHTTFLSTW